MINLKTLAERADQYGWFSCEYHFQFVSFEENSCLNFNKIHIALAWSELNKLFNYGTHKFEESLFEWKLEMIKLKERKKFWLYTTHKRHSLHTTQTELFFVEKKPLQHKKQTFIPWKMTIWKRTLILDDRLVFQYKFLFSEVVIVT